MQRKQTGLKGSCAPRAAPAVLQSRCCGLLVSWHRADLPVPPAHPRPCLLSKTCLFETPEPDFPSTAGGQQKILVPPGHSWNQVFQADGQWLEFPPNRGPIRESSECRSGRKGMELFCIKAKKVLEKDHTCPHLGCAGLALHPGSFSPHLGADDDHQDQFQDGGDTHNFLDKPLIHSGQSAQLHQHYG